MAVINMEMSFEKLFSSYRKLCCGVKNVPAVRVFIETLSYKRRNKELIAECVMRWQQMSHRPTV